MTFNRNAFWNGFWGCMFAAAILYGVIALFGLAVNHGRFRAAQECIAEAQTKDVADACLRVFVKATEMRHSHHE